MRARQSPPPPSRPALPRLWLLSDQRNDTMLSHTLAHLPRGSGFIFRHYHLPPAARKARFAALARAARQRGHLVVLAGGAREAGMWGADGLYCLPAHLRGARGQVRIATAHSLRELALAARAQADAVCLSPVFATRSHPGAKALGPVRFRLLARLSPVPVIALGGMSARTARRARWPRWGAIDGHAQR